MCFIIHDSLKRNNYEIKLGEAEKNRHFEEEDVIDVSVEKQTVKEEGADG